MNARMMGQRPDTSVKAPPVRYSLRERLSHVFIPANISYTSLAPEALDQGQYSDCVANGTAVITIADTAKHGHGIVPSRNAWYAQAQNDFYPPAQDNGLETGDCVRIFNVYGYVPESVMPYPPDGDVAKLLKLAASSAWIKGDLPKSFASVSNDLDSIDKALYSKGPVLFGGAFAKAWTIATNEDGSLPIPDQSAGGHCYACFGKSSTVKLRDDVSGIVTTGGRLCLNSWGPRYGFQPLGARSGGWFWLPDYIWTNPAYSQFIPSDVYTLVLP